MSRQERELRKELLLLKGEALRLRTALELEHWRGSLRLATAGATLWRSLVEEKTLLNWLALFLPSRYLRDLCKASGKLMGLLKLGRRWWAALG